MLSKAKQVVVMMTDIISIKDLNLANILFDKKYYENILIYDVSYKRPYGAGPLCIVVDEVDEFIRDYA